MAKANSELVQNMLNLREWNDFEAKRAAVQPRKLLEIVCAFVNGEGGFLVVGFEDEKKAQNDERLIGISENPDTVSEFLKLLKIEFDPPLQLAVSSFEESITNRQGVDDKLLIIRVQKSNDIHSLKNGDTFIRRGNQNVKIGAQEILRLRYERGSIKFEDEDTQISDLSELDSALLDKYKTDTISQNQDDLQFLKDNGLANKKKNNFILNKASILLFGKNPAVLLSCKCSIKISHYFGIKPTFSGEPNFVRRPFTIEGPLVKQIEQTVEYFRQVVRESSPKLQGGTFRPRLLIPEWVFQEAIANAVIHRNYQVQNDIQVRFFDDRLEIESPGSYPAHITSANLRAERFARNPVIQRVLSRFSEAPNLDIGEGVDRMFELMKTHNLYEPIYFPASVRQNSVLLYLMNIHKVDYWDTVSQYLDHHGSITNQVARNITGISDTLQVSRLFGDWVEKGLLERKGGKTRGAYYIKTGQDIQNLFAKSIFQKA